MIEIPALLLCLFRHPLCAYLVSSESFDRGDAYTWVGIERNTKLVGLSSEFISNAGERSVWQAFVHWSKLDSREISRERVAKVIAEHLPKMLREMDRHEIQKRKALEVKCGNPVSGCFRILIFTNRRLQYYLPHKVNY